MIKIPESIKGVKLRRIIYILVLIAAVVLRLINIDVPLMNQAHEFRQSQTAIAVQRFFLDGFDPIHYQVPVFGEPWSLPFEFPIYQIVLYLIMLLGGLADITVCGRILSISVFVISAIILHVLIKEIANERIADVTAVVYLFSPFDIYWSRAVLVDYLSVLFALVYVLLFVNYLKKGKPVFAVCGVLAGILAYLQKASTMFPYVVFLAFVILDGVVTAYKKSTRNHFFKWLINDIHTRLSGYVSVFVLAVVPVIPVMIWDRYADAIKSEGNCFYRSLVSDNLNEWFYGSPEQRLDPACWSGIFQKLTSLCGGPLLLLFLVAIYFLGTKKEYIKYLLFAAVSVVSAPLILFNLYYRHSYYFIAVTPVFAFFIGIMMYEMFKGIWNRKLLVIIFLSTIILYNYRSPYLDATYYYYRVVDPGVNLLEQLTTVDDQIICADGDWNPIVFYTIERRGLMLYHYDGYSFDTVYEEVLSNDHDDYSYLYGYIMEDIISVINMYPDNIQMFSYPYYGAKLYSDESFPVSDIEENAWSVFDTEVNTDDEQLIRFDRNGDRSSAAYAVRIETETQILDTAIIFAEGSDYAYLSTKGVSGIMHIEFETADIITMSSVEFNIT